MKSEKTLDRVRELVHETTNNHANVDKWMIFAGEDIYGDIRDGMKASFPVDYGAGDFDPQIDGYSIDMDGMLDDDTVQFLPAVPEDLSPDQRFFEAGEIPGYYLKEMVKNSLEKQSVGISSETYRCVLNYEVLAVEFDFNWDVIEKFSLDVDDIHGEDLEFGRGMKLKQVPVRHRMERLANMTHSNVSRGGGVKVVRQLAEAGLEQAHSEIEKTYTRRVEEIVEQDLEEMGVQEAMGLSTEPQEIDTKERRVEVGTKRLTLGRIYVGLGTKVGSPG